MDCPLVCFFSFIKHFWCDRIKRRDLIPNKDLGIHLCLTASQPATLWCIQIFQADTVTLRFYFLSSSRKPFYASNHRINSVAKRGKEQSKGGTGISNNAWGQRKLLRFFFFFFFYLTTQTYRSSIVFLCSLLVSLQFTLILSRPSFNTNSI